MKLDYDRETDSLTAIFIDTLVEESDEIRPGITIDFDAEGRMVGMEILNASQKMDNPTSVEFSVKAA